MIWIIVAVLSGVAGATLPFLYEYWRGRGLSITINVIGEDLASAQFREAEKAVREMILTHFARRSG